MPSVNIAVFVSGNGSNLQAIIDAIEKGKINGKIKLVVSNKKEAYALKRAKINNIPTLYYSKKDDEGLLDILKGEDIDLIVLAGYLKILSSKLISQYENKIINIHPSLLPAFGGQGFYGLNVHRAVIERACKITGATTHFVDEGTDTGPIILQDIVRIDLNDDAEDLQKKVLRIEHKILVDSVRLYCENKLLVNKNKVFIRE